MIPARACLLFACLLLAGCMRRPVRPNFDVPVACVRKVTLVGCDPATEQPRCEKIAVDYAKGCAQLKLPH